MHIIVDIAPNLVIVVYAKNKKESRNKGESVQHMGE